jgi:hypothetical protein
LLNQTIFNHIPNTLIRNRAARWIFIRRAFSRKNWAKYQKRKKNVKNFKKWTFGDVGQLGSQGAMPRGGCSGSPAFAKEPSLLPYFLLFDEKSGIYDIIT